MKTPLFFFFLSFSFSPFLFLLLLFFFFFYYVSTSTLLEPNLCPRHQYHYSAFEVFVCRLGVNNKKLNKFRNLFGYFARIAVRLGCEYWIQYCILFTIGATVRFSLSVVPANNAIMRSCLTLLHTVSNPHVSNSPRKLWVRIYANPQFPGARREGARQGGTLTRSVATRRPPGATRSNTTRRCASEKCSDEECCECEDCDGNP